MGDTTDKFQIRKPEWQAWGLAMTVFTFAVLVTFRAYNVDENEAEVTASVLLWMGLSYTIWRAIMRPAFVTVDSSGITYHGFFGGSKIKWDQIEEMDLKRHKGDSNVIRAVIFKGPYAFLEVSDLFAANLVDDLIAHLQTRKEAKKILRDREGELSRAEPRGVDPITKQLNMFMLGTFGFSLFASGLAAVYLHSFEVGIPAMLAGIIVAIFFNQMWAGK